MDAREYFPNSEFTGTAICGSFLTKQSKLLRKTWHPRFFLLDRNATDGLHLLYFKVVNGSIRKPKGMFKLESGCVVRDLPPSETGGRENCFHVITADATLKLQAVDAEQRKNWATVLDAQIKFEMELALYNQKKHLLLTGGDAVWHLQDAHKKKCFLALGRDSRKLEIVDEDHDSCSKIDIAMVETVSPGKQTKSLRKLSEEEVDRNCLSLILRADFPSFGKSIDLEFKNQSVRDDWVSAFQAVLHGPPNTTKAMCPAPNPCDTLNPRAVDDPGDPPPTPATTDAPASTTPKGRQSLRARLTRTVTGGNRRSSAFQGRKSLRRGHVSSPAEYYNDAPSPSGPGAPELFDVYNSTGASSTLPKKKGIFKTPELTELFKTKMKVQEGIPYGLFVSKALVTALKDVQDTPTPSEGSQAFQTAQFSARKHFSLNRQKYSHDKKDVSVELYDYAAPVFKDLRKQYGIEEDDYVNSLSQLTGDGFMGNGKSGMLFFFTRDRKYVLKTVKQSETDLFVNKGMIKGYYEHMQEYPDSLICRFLGFYRIKIAPQTSFSSAKWMGLLIMSNSFDTPLVMHEKYDLKGSTRKRWCEPRFGSVLKDLNFTGKIYIDKDERDAMLVQIRKDAEFMLAYNVMDYSLLLGIYKPPEPDATRNLALLSLAEDVEQQATRKGVSRWQRDFGGIEGRSPDGKPEVYLMCLIDILQVYDFSKRAENMYKSTMADTKEISAIEPKKYIERFMAYCNSIIVGVEGVRETVAQDRETVKRELRGSRANLEKATAAAVKRAAVDKANSSGMTFAFTLEDGTVLESFEDGTKVQRDADGVMITQKPDGTLIQTNSNGMVIERHLDGSFTQDHPDGTHIVVHPVPDDDATVAPDEKRLISTQELPHGTVIKLYSDGSRFQEFEDGTTIHVDKDGNKRQVEVNGTVVEVLTDGSKVQRNPNGTVIETDPDGVKRQKYPSGKVVTIHPDGKTSVKPAATTRPKTKKSAKSKKKKGLGKAKTGARKSTRSKT